mgnify:CR=1 FL=1
MPKKDSEIELEVSVLEVIAESCKGIALRLESLVKDYYNDNLNLTKSQHCLLMDFTAASTTLSYLLSDYITKAPNNSMGSIPVTESDFALIMHLAKTVELAQRSQLGNICLWTN